MVKKIIVIGVIAFGFLTSLNAQFTDITELKIKQDPRIDSLVKLHQQVNQAFIDHEEHDGIEGFRVQIFFDSGNNSKNRVGQKKDGFERRYPEVKAYMIYKEPYYKLRVGDFRTKLEAEGFLNRIRSRYPGAYVVGDKIKFPAL